MPHTCHAHGCHTPVPPRMFMCRDHWRVVSPRMQKAIWAEYREGQENDKRPSLRYLAVQQRAIGEVAFAPFDPELARVSAEYIMKSEKLREAAIEAGEGDPLWWRQRLSQGGNPAHTASTQPPIRR